MANRVLIIGAGGVGRVVAFKCAQRRDIFNEITFASRHADCKVVNLLKTLPPLPNSLPLGEGTLQSSCSAKGNLNLLFDVFVVQCLP